MLHKQYIMALIYLFYFPHLPYGENLKKRQQKVSKLMLHCKYISTFFPNEKYLFDHMCKVWFPWIISLGEKHFIYTKAAVSKDKTPIPFIYYIFCRNISSRKCESNGRELELEHESEVKFSEEFSNNENQLNSLRSTIRTVKMLFV